jgi:hypothetical protein
MSESLGVNRSTHEGQVKLSPRQKRRMEKRQED